MLKVEYISLATILLFDSYFSGTPLCVPSKEVSYTNFLSLISWSLGLYIYFKSIILMHVFVLSGSERFVAAYLMIK